MRKNRVNATLVNILICGRCTHRTAGPRRYYDHCHLYDQYLKPYAHRISGTHLAIYTDRPIRCRYHDLFVPPNLSQKECDIIGYLDA